MRRLGARAVAFVLDHRRGQNQALRLASRLSTALIARNQSVSCARSISASTYGEIVYRPSSSAIQKHVHTCDIGDASEWQTLAESILVPVYAEKYRLSACVQSKKQVDYVRPHKHHRRVRPVDEILEVDGTYRHSAFADMLVLYNKCWEQARGSRQRTVRLRVIATEIAKSTAAAVHGWVRLGQQQQLLVSQLLYDYMELDQRYDETCALSIATFQALCQAELLPRLLYPVCMNLFEKIDSAAMYFPEMLAEVLFALFYQGKCFEQITHMAKGLNIQAINAEIARWVLCSIRNKQKQRLQECNIYKPQPRKHGCLPDADAKNYWTQNQSQYSRDARWVLWQLEQRNRQFVSPAHLTKLLDIDIASGMGLPRGIDVLLRDFTRLDISPDVKALTLIINTYIENGDYAYACRIYEHMCSGKILVAQDNGNILPKTIPVPQPNNITLLTIAKVWCAEGDYDRVIDVLESMRQRGMSDSQQLVTRLVACMVDSRELDAAESVWTKYGCDYKPFTPKHGCKTLLRVNRRALAKLIIGHTHAGNVDRAISLLQVACNRERHVVGLDHHHSLSAETPYLTDLLNTVLRECLGRQHTTKGHHSLLLRRDLSVLDIGIRCSVRFNVATYNVLLSSLSRAAYITKDSTPEEAENQEISDVTRKEIASIMQRLYWRMLDEGIAPDDTSFVHLVPMWVYMNKSPLAVTHWRMLMEGKPPHKAERLRAHVVRQAKRWRLSVKTLSSLLLDHNT